MLIRLAGKVRGAPTWPDSEVTVAGRPLEEVADPFVLEVHQSVQPEDAPPSCRCYRRMRRASMTRCWARWCARWREATAGSQCWSAGPSRARPPGHGSGPAAGLPGSRRAGIPDRRRMGRASEDWLARTFPGLRRRPVQGRSRVPEPHPPARPAAPPAPSGTSPPAWLPPPGRCTGSRTTWTSMAGHTAPARSPA